MTPPPSKENPKKEEGEKYHDPDATSSWFGSWFERDMRNEIHDQLNAFEERKKRYEEAQKQRQRFFEENSSGSFPFPFFFPPENGKDEFEEVFGRIPQRGLPGGFQDDDENSDERRRRHGGFFENDGDTTPNNRDHGIEDIHREIQDLFEAAFAGGMMPPSDGSQHPRGGNQSWSSSSTVVSSSNGTTYTIKQDSKNGARVDLRLPKNVPSEKVSVEVLQERPCLFRWKNMDEGDASGTPRSNNQQHGQVLELGDTVDCSKLSASISKAKQTLTIEAPAFGRRTKGEGEDPSSLSRSQQPRPVPVTRTN